jgi:tetratricopeptide (TPR) repeat protein
MLDVAPESGYPQRTSDLIEEIRFYASQGMWQEAHRALETLEHEAPEAAHGLRAELGAPATSAAEANLDPFAAAATHFAEPVELDSQPLSADIVALPEPIAFSEPEFAPESTFVQPDAVPETLVPLEVEPAIAEAAEPIAPPISTTPAVQPEPAALPLEIAAFDDSESFFDLDAALGDDFELAPAATSKETPAFAASADLASATASTVPAEIAASSAVQTMSAAAGSQHTFNAHASQATAIAVAPPPAPPVSTSSMTTPASIGGTSGTTDVPTDGAFDFSDSALADIFAEFKNDMEGGSSDGEDPETHYNLGVAFKEMGLLDEAIGELQKVCQSIERGHAFPQVLQAYTWLADCFVQKGVPEAAIRWYEKALRSPHAEGETATAIHYELACACEQAGNRPGALSHFMEVYGANIDYRDVADRIKALK